MRAGKEFEVPKEVYDRAAANGGYMVGVDKSNYFSDSILVGYGLYSCKIREEGGKYICSYMIGDSCD